MQEWITLSYTIPKKKFKILFDGIPIMTFLKKSRNKLGVNRIKTDTSRQVE
jgi:hypothetical protein